MIIHMKIGEFLERQDFSFLRQVDTSASEERSWRRSLPHLQRALRGAGLEEHEIFLEYPLPNSHERIDALIVGEELAIVELKQWSDENVTKADGRIVEVSGSMRLNPCRQVDGYRKQMEYYLDRPFVIHTAVFLHNMKRFGCSGAEVFLRGDHERLGRFVRERVKAPSPQNVAFLKDPLIRPTKKLVDAVNTILTRRGREFSLSTEQQEIFWQVVDDLLAKGRKEVVIEGPPGSGKSLLAIHLHRFFLNKGLSSLYMTKTKAPREVLGHRLEADPRHFFAYPDKFRADIAIVDEAHRLTPELLDGLKRSAKHIIYFTDRHQRVHCNDIGVLDPHYRLQAQFRCGSSQEYLEWIDALLYGEREPQKPFDYEFVIAEDIDEFADLVKRRRGRLLAGYCWEWRSKNDPAAYDIEIEGRKWRWNRADKRQFLWAVDEEQRDRVGCIHTVQGQEIDFAGVIIGDDLDVEGDRLVAVSHRHSSDDPALRGCDDSAAQELILNAYRVLLTRGMRGTAIYCTNEAVARYFRRRLEALRRRRDQSDGKML